MEQEIALRIILENPPANVDFGLQKGSGHQYETIQKQRFYSQHLRFDFTVRVKGNPANDFYPVFLGQFVQGDSTARFVYIDIGTYAGQADSKWNGRMKIPLRGNTWEVIRQLSETVEQTLVTHVPGTGKNGEPTYGTIKPFAGWQPG